MRTKVKYLLIFLLAISIMIAGCSQENTNTNIANTNAPTQQYEKTSNIANTCNDGTNCESKPVTTGAS
ncbi:MAG: hypothetical protein WC758_02510 [Candidatus Woesearchaeota archaeon]|jgi:uncharacterized lipoprotein YajG